MIYVIIPVYNTGPYLEECLNSAFEQNVDKRIICVDDGSTDGSSDILKKLQFSHPELTVLYIENSGPSHARNVGLDYVFHGLGVSIGDFITFLDSDDFVRMDYLNVLEDALIHDDSDIVCCNFCFYHNGASRPFALKPPEAVLNGFEATKELLSDRSIQSHSPCKLYRANLWKEVRFPEEIVAMEDQGTIFKLFCKARRVSFIDYDGYLYRQRGDSVCSAKITNKRVLDSIRGYLLPCIYEYPEFSIHESEELRKTALGAFALVYLMMVPRFDKRNASPWEKNAYKAVSDLEHNMRAVFKLKPQKKSEFFKKWTFLVLRPFYAFLYKRYLIRRERNETHSSLQA